MIKKLSILIVLILNSSILLSQVKKDTNYIDSLLGNICVWENIEEGTKEIMFHGGYILKDNLDNIIADGNKSGDCGCQPIANGFWVFYYQNGKIKEQGSFDCGEKVNTWITFYKNGSIKQVKTFKKPYSASFVRQFGDTLNLRRIKPMKHGQFLEYYENGQLMMSGQYDIIHLKSTSDSIVILDNETYDKTYEIIEGEFWLPKSIKIGTWKYYDIGGNIEKIENFKREEYDWRELDYKYWELFKLMNKKHTHNNR